MEGLEPDPDGDKLYKPSNTNGAAPDAPDAPGKPAVDKPLPDAPPAKKPAKKDVKP